MAGESANIQEVQPVTPSRGNIARQLMKDAGMPIDNDKLVESHRLAVDTSVDEPGTTAANIGEDGEGEEGAGGGPASEGAGGEPVVEPAKTPKQQPAKTGAEAPAEPAVDEKALLKYLNEKNGTAFKSLDELKPPTKELSEEEKQTLEQQEEDAAIAYALEHKLIDRKTLDQYAVDKAKPARDIALQIFGEKLKAINPKIEDADIADKFSEYMHEYQDDDSPLKILGEQTMQAMADGFIKEKYANVLNVKDPYTNHKTVTEQAKTFRSQITEAASELPRELKFTIPVEVEGGGSKDFEYSFTVSDDVIKAVRADFLKPEVFEALRQRNLDKAALSDAINTAVLKKLQSQIMSVVAKSHADKMLSESIAHRKSIPTQAGQGTAFKLPGGNRNSIARQAMQTT